MAAKGYWVLQADISNPAGFKIYQEDVRAVLKMFGARFVVFGGRSEIVEGNVPSRTALIEFKDYETAVACWNSPQYSKSKSLRMDHATFHVVIVEGYDGLQPSDH